METTETNQRPEKSLGIVKLILRAFRFPIRHPLITIVIALLCVFSSVSFLAHFNPAIADRFNNSVKYFGLAALTSVATDSYRATKSVYEKRSKQQADRLTKLDTDLKVSKTSNLQMKAEMKQRNAVIKSQAAQIKQQSAQIRNQKQSLAKTKGQLKSINSKLKSFGRTGKSVESRISKRFTKVAFMDAAGEVIGIIPLVGDAASIGLTAGGIYEMCLMFKEIERATIDLGVPYKVYTGTFCEKPAEKSITVVKQATNKAGNYMSDQVFSVQQYWSARLSEWF